MNPLNSFPLISEKISQYMLFSCRITVPGTFWNLLYSSKSSSYCIVLWFKRAFLKQIGELKLVNRIKLTKFHIAMNYNFLKKLYGNNWLKLILVQNGKIIYTIFYLKIIVFEHISKIWYSTIIVSSTIKIYTSILIQYIIRRFYHNILKILRIEKHTFYRKLLLMVSVLFCRYFLKKRTTESKTYILNLPNATSNLSYLENRISTS